MRREVCSPIAGSVESHAVSIGQHVKTGSTLIIVECMKTQFAVESLAEGVVTWLRPCGETIEADDIVAALEVAG